MKVSTPIFGLACMLALACGHAAAGQDNLGLVGAQGTQFGNTFYSATSGFTDYYTFRIEAPGTVSGTTIDGAPSTASGSYSLSAKDVVLTSIILGNPGFSQYYGVDLSIPKDGSTNTFNFASLAAGTYKLAVTGYVSDGKAGSASYSGVIRTNASVASPAPEPADLALTLMGLAGVGFMLRKQRRAA